MTKKVKVNPAEEGWEIKDRTYMLRGDKNPLTFTIKSRHTEKSGYKLAVVRVMHMLNNSYLDRHRKRKQFPED